MASDAHPARWSTRSFALTRPEVATSAVAVVASSSLYVHFGHPYLARGVVGDVVALGLLAAAGRWRGARLRHEAAWCALGIAVVVAAEPAWPLRAGDLALWLVTGVALAGYLRLRQQICD